MDKKTILIICGGSSLEHEVSIRSTRSIINNIDESLFNVLIVGISKNLDWFLLTENEIQTLEEISNNNCAKDVYFIKKDAKFFIQHQETKYQFDALFPMMHGTLGEDGSIQGFCNIYGIPCISTDLNSSAIAINKSVAKKVLSFHQIPVVPFVEIQKNDQIPTYEELTKVLHAQEFFVKPANLGSSVGVEKVKNEDDYKNAYLNGFKIDKCLLVEKAINAREIECSVLNTCDKTIVSKPCEVIPSAEFYTYHAKYVDPNGAAFEVPAKITNEQTQEIMTLALTIFNILGASHMARIDFFICKDTGSIYLNEINTIPGFTTISMYPKMLEASGIKYSEIITALILRSLNVNINNKSNEYSL
jgi:D-alanine-D-alanine ligase